MVAHVGVRAGARAEVPAALAVFARGSTNVAWSSYRGSWQLIEIETNTWSWPQGCGIWLAIVFGPILYFGAAIWLSTHGLVLLAEEMIGLVVAAGIAGGLVALARRAAFPRFAEFDGQVIRQWMVKGGDESPDEYHRPRCRGRLPGRPGRRGDGLGADRAHQHPRNGAHRV